ncbi:hypothetical protein SAMN03080618_03272 [Aquamicrobium aerolatum DSM 21857]|jgi:hypothetical protein|uniref:Uncharacterized protein n=2 Tax=Hyphomicrobiales TaxID=356 RepID=A0A1I3S9H5_9HYPH|nr:hypothetical protein SAMN03080618_03272 [Aquamicrobium aerolatum DSM 21857]
MSVAPCERMERDFNLIGGMGSRKEGQRSDAGAPDDYVFPGAPIAFVKPMVEGAEEVIRNATTLGPQRGSSAAVALNVW